MESHLFKIDTWEFFKGVFTWAFWMTWFVVKMIWPFLLVMVFVGILPKLFKLWRKRKKEQIGFKS